jgi:hydroxylamine dehydrogenase
LYFRRVMMLTVLVLLYPHAGVGGEIPVSEATQACLECHAVFHPGIVADWQASRHAATTPARAMKADALARKVSSKEVPDKLRRIAVGCAECHGLRAKDHADTFEHNGYQIHVVVSPEDCRTCHATEADQYSRNLMAHAVNNLAGNRIFNQLEYSILATRTLKAGQLKSAPADADTRAEACYYCHGTTLKVTGSEKRDTDAGEMMFPVIDGWPNQGVGRINPDGSMGACSACHTRHRFSMEVARKPHTCRECHVGPDVPAYKVYMSSKHGNIYASQKRTWDFAPVPWTVGRDFSAPTCAACHMSLLVNTDGEVINRRTHEIKDRLPWRIFGLIYAHPQPKSPDTTIIRNGRGRPMPTDFKGGLADGYLIGPDARDACRQTLQATCRACHDAAWIGGHWRRFENTIVQSNQAVRTATDIMAEAWNRGYARGLDQDDNPFDEHGERLWSDAWLLYANTIRFSSAMAGGGDYTVFADGHYQLSRTLVDLQAWLENRKLLETLKAGKAE